IKKQFLCGDDNFIKLVDCFKNLKGFGENINQFFSDDILINYKFDEWIENLKSSGNLDEWIKNLEYSGILGEWIKNLGNSGNLDVIKKLVLCGDEIIIRLADCFKILKSFDVWCEIFLDNDKNGKESSDDHKYKSKYIQKDSNSLLIPLP
ncbi:20211_t:CDS:2, partial [Gigaspora rosea]